MKRNSMLTKIIAVLLCALMVAAWLPKTSAAANDFESGMDRIYGTDAANAMPLVIGTNADSGLANAYYAYTPAENGTLTLTAEDGTTFTVDGVAYTDAVAVTADTKYIIVATNEAKAHSFDAAVVFGCAHANTTTTTVDATCTEAGSITVTCDDCGETISTEEIPALNHDYTGENGACVNCGEYQVDETLVFYNKGIVLSADIRGVLQIRKTKATSPYESFMVIAEKGGVETELELATFSETSTRITYSFAMTVPAKELADVTNLRIIGITADGVYRTSINYPWSIKEGLISSMDTYSAQGTEDAALRTKLCANILNYGAEAQKHFNYATDNLATKDLKKEYADLIITTTPEMEAIPKAEEPAGTYATLTEIGFNLAARVQVLPRFKVPKTDAKESYSAQITKVHVAPDGTETTTSFTLSGDKILKGATSTSLYVYIDNLASKELRDVMTITLMKDGKAVSVIHTFSGESALYGKMSSLPALAPALMNYCDCARAVFG